MKHSPKRARSFAFKLGNVYQVHLDDHFSCRGAPRDAPDMRAPLAMRAIGKLVAVTKTQINLETWGPQDDTGPHDIHAILLSCIREVHDLGPIRGQKR